MKILLFAVLLLLATNPLLAQKENNVWVGGDFVGLDFNSGSPVLFERPANQNIWRTNAAICDSIAWRMASLIAAVSIGCVTTIGTTGWLRSRSPQK